MTRSQKERLERPYLIPGEFYWINAPGIDPEHPLTIGEYLLAAGKPSWQIDGAHYDAGGLRITVIAHIPKPKIEDK